MVAHEFFTEDKRIHQGMIFAGDPAMNRRILSMARATPASVVSGVVAAECGVRITLGRTKKGLFDGRGSCSKTSRPAPAIWLVCKASTRSLSLTIAPRAVLIRIALGFIILKCSRRIIPTVSGDWRT